MCRSSPRAVPGAHSSQHPMGLSSHHESFQVSTSASPLHRLPVVHDVPGGISSAELPALSVVRSKDDP